ncbi:MULTISPECIES: hypothetical protein [Exiguobacterium]|uniref:hypothetical protein n=1 Tax=Exiguobacterium TaxID=33986 RepID=UPI001BE96056|nr:MULTISPECIES: hypothetical protein [Exiguobacterium]MCT4782786.1 hypothetical protein [Exiguobacterium himgiriensis]
MKRNKNRIWVGLTMAVSIALSGCFAESKATPKNEKVVDETVAPSESKRDSEVRLSHAGEIEALGEVSTYDLSLFFADQAPMIAPEHLVDTRIIYTHLTSEATHEVFVYDTEQASNQSIYKTSKTIGNLVGINDELVWSEYEKVEDNASSWKIYRMKLGETKPTELSKGISAFQTSPPYVVLTENGFMWVDHKATETVTTSNLVQYSPTNGTVETLRTYTLQEGEKRDGEYPFDYRGSVDGALIHQSFFDQGDKTSRLVSADGSFDEEMGALIDFGMGTDYVAFGKEGRAKFVSKSSSQTFEYRGSQTKISFDAFRFLDDNRILFREGMNRLLIADLSQESVATLPNTGGTTSKPIYVDGRVAYGVLKDSGLITFNTIDIN